ncbi:aminotransferase [Frigidibacter sp. ROC022]|uniref:aminotransferase n=1 Tax=Frigidibacter sp. ROC022 TaxID=2971796 RepID=UPI00215AE7BC|nr:aminotransferase [Frigidibacter sp. ROC022]MCR8725570.1 aminotransferase [Frigidibacter sp. ROC022]
MPPFNPRLLASDPPAVIEALRWLDGVRFPPDRPLMMFSQAAPAAPPPEPLRRALAEIVMNDPAAHLYGPDLGLPELRAELAATTARRYGGTIRADQVAITSGANQAFTAAVSSLAGEGDEVLLPTPWYFNHKMHCDMTGVRAVPLPTGATLIPDPGRAETLITERTRAIALVTPNNPGGTEYPAEVLRAFRDLARAHGLALILDETYRDFHARPGPPHDLFADPDWDDTLIHLYSFSKAYRLTGHRVGAMIASAERLTQVEKYIDTVTICPNQLGQRAALWGLRNLDTWLAGERDEILARRAAMEQGLAALPGWRLLGLGAYFAYVRHPFALSSPEVAQRLVRDASILLLPGTMFRPATQPEGRQELRIAFANADRDGIAELFDRLAGVNLPLAPAPEAL